jgi:hypothetical protein
MIHRFAFLRRHGGWHRKLALGVMLVLQGAIALSPLLEVTERARMGAHAEERGAQHKYQHDEATCALCGVRSLHAAPSQRCPAIECERQQSVAALDAPRAPAARAASSALARAPPQHT